MNLNMLFLRFRFSYAVRLRANLSFRFNAIIVVFGNGLSHLIILNFLDSHFSSYDSVKEVNWLLNFSLLAIQIQPSLYLWSLVAKYLAKYFKWGFMN